MNEFLTSLSTVEKVFFSSAVLGGLMFVFRMVMLFVGGDTDADVDGDFDVDTEIGGDVDVGEIAAEGVDVGDGDFDVDTDLDAADEAYTDSDASFRMLSYHGLMAFFLLFGMVGLAMTQGSGAGVGWAVLGAVLGGLAMMWIVARVMVSMHSLHSSGTLNIYDAIGAKGTVYLRIRPGGVGKVQVNVQDRLRTFDAVTEGDEEIQTGEPIRVMRVVKGNVMVVERSEPRI